MKQYLLTSLYLGLSIALLAQTPPPGPPEFQARYGGSGVDPLSSVGNLTFEIDGNPKVIGVAADAVGAFDPSFNSAGYDGDGLILAAGIAGFNFGVFEDFSDTPTDEGISNCVTACETFQLIAFNSSNGNYYVYRDLTSTSVPKPAVNFPFIESGTQQGTISSMDNPFIEFNFVDPPFVFPALPIVLFSFEAKDQGESVLLDWVTATETNNDYFTLERSSDGETFRPVGTVQGAGTSTTPQQYQFTDADPLFGTSYYRIKQTDFDGAYTYTPARSITRMRSQVDISPNPTNGEVFVRLPELGAEENVTLTIYNQLGQPVKTLDWTGMTGSESLDLSELAQGTYHLQFRSRTLQASQSMVKL